MTAQRPAHQLDQHLRQRRIDAGDHALGRILGDRRVAGQRLHRDDPAIAVVHDLHRHLDMGEAAAGAVGRYSKERILVRS